jgi:hypothetical protein
MDFLVRADLLVSLTPFSRGNGPAGNGNNSRGAPPKALAISGRFVISVAVIANMSQTTLRGGAI